MALRVRDKVVAKIQAALVQDEQYVPQILGMLCVVFV